MSDSGAGLPAGQDEGDTKGRNPSMIKKGGFYISSVPEIAGEKFEWKHRESDFVMCEGHRCPSRMIMQYGEPPERHLMTGLRDCKLAVELLQSAGYKGGNILDFACSNGRVLRHFPQLVEGREFWGVDIDSRRVLWASEHIDQPCHFLTISTFSHLPFPDGFFAAALGYSIFTHLDELFMSWLQELRRVTQVGGQLVITIHDEQAVENSKEVHGAVKDMADKPWFTFMEKDVRMAYYRTTATVLQTFIKRDHFVRLVSSFFDIVDFREKTMGGFQTAAVLRKR